MSRTVCDDVRLNLIRSFKKCSIIEKKKKQHFTTAAVGLHTQTHACVCAVGLLHQASEDTWLSSRDTQLSPNVQSQAATLMWTDILLFCPWTQHLFKCVPRCVGVRVRVGARVPDIPTVACLARRRAAAQKYPLMCSHGIYCSPSTFPSSRLPNKTHSAEWPFIRGRCLQRYCVFVCSFLHIIEDWNPNLRNRNKITPYKFIYIYAMTAESLNAELMSLCTASSANRPVCLWENVGQLYVWLKARLDCVFIHV